MAPDTLIFVIHLQSTCIYNNKSTFNRTAATVRSNLGKSSKKLTLRSFSYLLNEKFNLFYTNIKQQQQQQQQQQ